MPFYVLLYYSGPFLIPLLNTLCCSCTSAGVPDPAPLLLLGCETGFISSKEEKIQKDIIYYIKGYGIIVITKISERSARQRCSA